MDISKLKLFGMMRTDLSYHGERQNVLAQNIANANTPGYAAKDLKPLSFDNIMSSVNSQVTASTTNPNHIAGKNSVDVFGRISDGKVFEISPTGNKLVLETQVMEASKNQMEYQQTAGIYRKMVEMFKTALGSN